MMKINHLLTKINHGKNCQYSKHNKGFTLIELLIAMFVGLIVLGATYAVFIAQNKELNKQEQIVVMQQNARMAMEMMTREIMMAGYNQTTDPATIAAVPRCTNALVAAGTSCVGITSAGSNTIKFTADLNGSGSITPDDQFEGDNADENVAYDANLSLGIKSFRRNSKYTKSGSSYQPVVEYVDSLSFEYYDDANNTLLSPVILADICRIQITVTTRTANIDPNTGNYHYYPLKSYVTPRNLGITGY
ncbi:MAG: prepilin-type N-terminal cleavage/methylation domain-containing protein [Smithellaceae bacterium]|nr:prepilin-type N-terminal cleavage/methylation domain-containing protein [Smithellaceae bacterium]